MMSCGSNVLELLLLLDFSKALMAFCQVLHNLSCIVWSSSLQHLANGCIMTCDT